MRVCHLWDNFFPIEYGGVERYILNLSDHLTAQDPKMRFLLLTDRSTVSFLRAHQIPTRQKINSLEVNRLGPNLSSFLRNTHRKALKKKSDLFERLTVTNLFKQASKIPNMNKVDVFHLHGLWTLLFPTMGVMLSQHFKKPLVITLHGESVEGQTDFRMSLDLDVIKKALSHADAITTYSPEILNALQEMGYKKTSKLIPNFISTKHFVPPPTKKRVSGNRVLMISRLDETKDPLTAIRAFAYVIKEVPTATLQIVGYGPLYKEAKKLISELNLEESVSLLGKQSDVRSYLWNSDIFVSTRAAYIATLEAWASGLAVIAPNVGILKDVISDGENGLLVPPKEPRMLASAIASLLENNSLKNALARRGLETVQNHDIMNIASRFGLLYSSLA